MTQTVEAESGAKATSQASASVRGERRRLINPFDEDRLNEAADFRSEWDVPSFNAKESDWLVDLVKDVKERPLSTAARKMAVLLANAGYGKTHLFGRVAEALEQKVMFTFVGPIFEAQLSRPLQHILWNVVESLFDAPADGGPPWIDRILAEVCRPAFQSYFDLLPDLMRTRHQALRQRLQEDGLTVLEIVAKVSEVAAFQQLGDSLAAANPTLRAEIVRALALGWSPVRLEARRWLRGDDLPEQECARLGLSPESPEPERVIFAIAELLRQINVPLVICCDQLEAVLKDRAIGPMALSNGLVGLLQSVPNTQIVLGCLEDPWRLFVEQELHQSFLQRVHAARSLAPLTEDQALELVSRRVEGWSGNQLRGGTFPIVSQSIADFVGRGGRPPRALVQACRVAIDEWSTSDKPTVALGGHVVDPFPDVFIKHWNEQLAKVQERAKDPEDLQEARIFQSVRDALDVIREAKSLPAGVELLQMTPDVIEAGSNDPRPSVLLKLKIAGQAQTILVCVSKKDAGVAFAAYVKALQAAVKATNATGVVLVRPFAELKVGAQTAARKTYDKMVNTGQLRPFPLGQERLTFDQLECLFEVLQDSDDGLPLGGKELKRPDCVKLVAENRLLENLKLFEFIFQNWAASTSAASTSPVPTVAAAAATSLRPSPTASTQAGASIPAPAEPVTTMAGSAGAASVLPAIAKPAAPTAAAAIAATKLPTPVGTPAAESSGAPADETTLWAERLVEQVVEKLRKWNLPVRPDGVQVGPTFVRLRIRPSDLTDINKVRNKSEQLRVNLGLPARPLIGFQAGYISVDVQRPTRVTVPLAPLLTARPDDMKGQPAFPAGLDVAGEAHWLDLAGTANCHLLIAGTTGSGKSEFLKVLLGAMAHGLSPQQLQFILIDPKRVTFNLSGPSPYLQNPIAYDHEEALPLIEWCVDEMERRYQLLAARRFTNVSELTGTEAVPRVVLVFDEFADLMLDKAAKKELEPLLKRLGAKARAAGIHLVLGTQRTEASVVTPILRSNLPGRISLRVPTDKDSALILDAPGAADLLGKGDLLWRQGGDLVRLQSPFISNADLEKLLQVS